MDFTETLFYCAPSTKVPMYLVAYLLARPRRRLKILVTCFLRLKRLTVSVPSRCEKYGSRRVHSSDPFLARLTS